MSIKTIEVICIPCHKCQILKNRVDEIIKNLELRYRIKIFYEYKHTPHLKDIARYSINPSQTPAVIINGNLELAGNIEYTVLKMKLENFNKQ